MDPFQLPTANRALFEPDGGERFFVGTVGKSWVSGGFGCVRSDRQQFHEGIDVRCLQRDKRGEPTDPVLATADGTVAYINRRPALSNYGTYIVLRHLVNGVEVYSLSAHLREVRPGLAPGQAVKAGEPIGVMGRTANTPSSISKDRAHVHFELNLLLNDGYAAWHRKHRPGQRNDHGCWNGQNMAGLDPRELLTAAQQQGGRFNLQDHIRNQPELCRVVVRGGPFPFLRRYPMLVSTNAAADRAGVAGYEIVLSFNGVPCQIIPHAAYGMKGREKVQLLSVNEAEYRRNPCRKLVVKRGTRWELGNSGADLISLLTFQR